MQNMIGHKGLETFIALNFDRFMMPGAILAALFAASYLGSL
ncbi:hypothetical protein [Roseovarius aquimarinus]|uniref:Uncharacterized protein n=1 Tax=Roseovarius aquimarinus TaxID=1229156 RepID=A0ABW7I402_9RHOB